MIQKLMLSALIMGAACAHAQTGVSTLLPLTPKQQKNLQFMDALVRQNPQTGIRGQKPTATQQRVVAQVIVSPDSYDSSRFHYSGTKGSRFDHTQIMATGYSNAFYPDASPAFEFYERASTDIMADSITYYEDALEPIFRSMASYNASGKLIGVIEKSLPDHEVARTITAAYNAAGQLTMVERAQADEDGVKELRKINYNAAGQVTTDSTFLYEDGEWYFNTVRNYYYNASGRLDSLLDGDSDYTNKFEFTYDTENRIIGTDLYYRIDEVGEYEFVQSEELTYTAGVDYPTSYTVVSVGDEGEEAMRLTKYPGSNPGPDSVSIDMMAMGVWINMAKMQYTYNDFGNPTQMDIIVSFTGESAGTMTFYYEDYDDGLSANNIHLSKELSVHPNPFNNTIHISYNGKNQEEAVVSLTDISGRSILNQSIVLQNGTNSINVPQIAAGTYILSIKDRNGNVYTNKMIKK
jgi:hypothetical protein